MSHIIVHRLSENALILLAQVLYVPGFGVSVSQYTRTIIYTSSEDSKEIPSKEDGDVLVGYEEEVSEHFIGR